jgi:ankyrin repeat protein
VQLLLAIGADPNIKAIGKEKFTALGFACGYADVMTVQILLQDKRTSMDAATVDIIEEGVLHLATNRVDNLGIVDCLLQQGADPLMVNAEGWSPLRTLSLTMGDDPTEHVISN